MKLNFELEQKAKSSGGDKYKCKDKDMDKFTIYFPQEISRKLFETKEIQVEFGETGQYNLELVKKANKLGGDKYNVKNFFEITSLSSTKIKWIIYIPQEICRNMTSVNMTIC